MTSPTLHLFHLKDKVLRRLVEVVVSGHSGLSAISALLVPLYTQK